MKLAENFPSELGATSAGSDWCMKALNPAHPRGYAMTPDGGSISRVLQVFERTVTIAKPAGLAGTYDFDMLVHSGIVDFAAIHSVNSTSHAWTNVHNVQMGATRNDALASACNHVEAYRAVAISVTGILDATSVSNSGLLAATQYVYTPVPLSYGGPIDFGFRGVRAWPDPPKQYDNLVSMPGTYVGAAKDGFYSIMHLDHPEWVYTNRVAGHINTFDSSILQNHAAMMCPFPALNENEWPFGLTSIRAGGLNIVEDLESSNNLVIHVAGRNLHTDATMRVTFRVAFELLVPPSTVFSMFLKNPPVLDEVALRNYRLISPSLKLAYSADYNDWQKIVKDISNVAQTLLPMLPGGGFLSQGIPLLEKGILGMGNAIAAKAKQRQAQGVSAQQQRVLNAAKQTLAIQRAIGATPSTSQKKKRNRQRKKKQDLQAISSALRAKLG